VEPPPVSHALAPVATLPPSAVDPDSLVERFDRLRERFAGAVRRTANLGVAIHEPAYPFIASLGGTLAFLAAHDRRHMWQAVQIRNCPRFPGVTKEEL
jgi:hypothetical protein